MIGMNSDMRRLCPCLSTISTRLVARVSAKIHYTDPSKSGRVRLVEFGHE